MRIRILIIMLFWGMSLFIPPAGQAQIELLGSCELPEYSRLVRVQGNYAFVTGGDQYLTIVDITQPDSPFVAATCQRSGDPWGLEAIDGYLLVADGLLGLQLIDIAEPLQPELAGEFDGFLNEHDVRAPKNIACLINCKDMYTVDISEPSSPIEIGNIHINSLDCNGIYVEGNYAYVLAYYEGNLVIVDVSDATNPVIRGIYGGLRLHDRSSQDLFVRNDYAYIPEGESLSIFDVSNPDDPVLAGNYDAGFYIYGLCVEENYMYLINNLFGLIVVDISDPASPVYVDRYQIYGYGYVDIVTRSGLIFAIKSFQLDILAFGQLDIDKGFEKADAIHSVDSYPNPFNPATTIRYALSEQSDVRLEVYDILGRMTTTLLDGHVEAGYHSVNWDASAFPSGVYFARLQAGADSQSLKMVLMK